MAATLNRLLGCRRFSVLILVATMAGLASRASAQEPGVWTLRSTTGAFPRWLSSMAFDDRRGVCVLFGGLADSVFIHQTFEWNGLQWNQLDVPGPPMRADTAMAYDARRGVTVLFGGFWRESPSSPVVWFADTWVWDGATWVERPVAGPSPRLGCAMTYDRDRQVVVLFGGADDKGQLNETWEWDGNSWSRRERATPTGPMRDGV